MKYLLVLLFALGMNVSFAETPDYVYSDGNGNKYELIGNMLHYIPVKKENSSSGEYSGGQPAEIEISSSTTKEIKSLMQKAMKAKGEQIEHREMGTGMIIQNTKKGDKIVILKMDSAAKKELEDYLKKIIAG